MRITGQSAERSPRTGATAPRRSVARWLVAGGVLLTLAPAIRATEGPTPGAVRLLEVDGVISPTSARYVARELDRAADDEAGAVVLRLDTPGGLDTSMRDV